MKPIQAIAASCLLLCAGTIAHAESVASGGLDCTIIAEAATGNIIHRQGTCDQRFSPASTFKFPLAIMGFDSGILTGPHDPVWDLKPEYEPSKREQAYQKVDPAIWEKESIVWFSQQLTRTLGEKRFADYVARFDYGNEDISGDTGRNNGLTHSWLMSSLTISPDEQIDFLHRFKARRLPVSERAYRETEATIATFPAGDGWEVHGKTGSGWLRDSDGKIDRARPQGWFVGWARKGGHEIIFARLGIGTRKSEKPGGLLARESLIAELPALLAGR
jgi:beta-lactamase class D